MNQALGTCSLVRYIRQNAISEVLISEVHCSHVSKEQCFDKKNYLYPSVFVAFLSHAVCFISFHTKAKCRGPNLNAVDVLLGEDLEEVDVEEVVGVDPHLRHLHLRRNSRAF